MQDRRYSTGSNAIGSQAAIVTGELKFKDDLITKMGGHPNFEFVLLSYCELIHDDPDLNPLFGEMQVKQLSDLQRELFYAAFVEDHTEDLQKLITFRFRQLFKKGLNETHFDKFQKHFLDALRDCWVQEDVYELCKLYFGDLRPIFKQHGKHVPGVERIMPVSSFCKSMRSNSLPGKTETASDFQCAMCQSARTYGALSAKEKREVFNFKHKQSSREKFRGFLNRRGSGQGFKSLFGLLYYKETRQR